MGDWGGAFAAGWDATTDRAQRERQLALQAEIGRGTLSLSRAAEERARVEQAAKREQEMWGRENPEVAQFPELYRAYPTPEAEPHTARAYGYSREAARLNDPRVRTGLALGEYRDPVTQQPITWEPGETPSVEGLRAKILKLKADAIQEAMDAFRRAQKDVQETKNSGRIGRQVPRYARDLEIQERALTAAMNELANRRQGVITVNNQPQFIERLIDPTVVSRIKGQQDQLEFQYLQQLRDLELAYGRRAAQYGEKWDQPLISPTQYAQMRAVELRQLYANQIPNWKLMAKDQQDDLVLKKIRDEIRLRHQGIFVPPWGTEAPGQ